MHEHDSVIPYPCLNPVLGNFFCSCWIISSDRGAAPEEKRFMWLRSYVFTIGSRTRRIMMGGTRRSSWILYSTTVLSRVSMVKCGSMMTSALSRMGRCIWWTRPVMWNSGSTARIFLCSGGVICWIWRHWDTTFWWDICTALGSPVVPEEKDRKSPKPWAKTLTTPYGRSQLSLNANSPGEYSIVDVKGQYCPGDVLSPETCRVVLQPYPTAEITWRRIHEW